MWSWWLPPNFLHGLPKSVRICGWARVIEVNSQSLVRHGEMRCCTAATGRQSSSVLCYECSLTFQASLYALCYCIYIHYEHLASSVCSSDPAGTPSDVGGHVPKAPWPSTVCSGHYPKEATELCASSGGLRCSGCWSQCSVLMLWRQWKWHVCQEVSWAHCSGSRLHTHAV